MAATVPAPRLIDTDEPSSELLLGPDERAIRDAVRQVCAEHVAPHAARADEKGEFPAAQMTALADAGLAALLTPAAYGGAGASVVAYAAAMEEVTRACGSTSTVYMTQMHCAHPLELAGTEEQKARCLPALASCAVYGALCVSEPEAGSDVAAMRTVARRDGESYVLDGSKTFITTGDRADVLVVFATVDRAAGRDGITAFLVEGTPEGMRRGAPMHKMGLRGSTTAELYFDDCRIPVSAVLGAARDGYALSMESVVRSRISAAAQGVGHAVGAYAAAVSWATARGLLGPARRDAQRVQFRLADIRSRIAAARTLLLVTARLVDERPQDAVTDVSLAKLRCTTLGVDVAAECVDLLGEEGDLARWGVERRLRDSKVAEIYDGTSEVQRMIIARDVRRRGEAMGCP
jgi:alkylation response protein AidB-like acyl-CoA dehydrogenase